MPPGSRQQPRERGAGRRPRQHGGRRGLEPAVRGGRSSPKVDWLRTDGVDTEWGRCRSGEL